jgi:hypothetical protein
VAGFWHSRRGRFKTLRPGVDAMHDMMRRWLMVGLFVFAAACEAGREAPPQDPPHIHDEEGFARQSNGKRPRKRDRLDGLLTGPYHTPGVLRPGESSPEPAPVDPTDLTPFPHQPPPEAPPPGPAEAIDRRTAKIELAKYPDRQPELAVHHLLGTVTLETSKDDAFSVTLVRRGTGADAAAAAEHRETIDLDVRTTEEKTVASTNAWGFPDFDRAIDYVKRGERPAEAHLFVAAPKRAKVLLCTWGGTVSIRDGAGRAKVITTAGQVDVQGYKGKLEILTSSGTVWLGGDLDADVLVRTVAGRILATGFAGKLDARSRIGEIQADFARVGPSDQAFWTETGSVDVTLPRTAEVVLDVHAPREHLISTLPLTNLQEGAERTRGVLNAPHAWVEIRNREGVVRVSGR